MVDVGYKKSLRMIHDDFKNHLELPNKTLMYTADVAQIFNDKIASLMREQCKQMGKKNIDLGVAYATLMKILPPGLYDIAVNGQGNRALEEYRSGILTYVDRSVHKDALEKAERLRKAGPFVDGIVDMIGNMEPILVETKYKMHLSELIFYVSTRLAKNIANKYGKKQVEAVVLDDVRQAVTNEFGLKLAEHANSEGMRHVFLFEGGFICIPPPTKDSFFKKPKPIAKPISRGIEELIELMGGTIETNCNEQALLQLAEFAKRFAKSIRIKSKNNRMMSYKEIELATRAFFPPIMADHALAEAYKCIALANQKTGQTAK